MLSLRCLVCTEGYFKDSTTNACKRCPKGSFSNEVGATDVSDCSGRKLFSSTLIYMHIYLLNNNNNNNTLSLCCLVCTKGYFKDSTTDQCKACPKGTFGGGVGATSCTPCSDGETTSGEGNTAQSQCRNGKEGPGTRF